ncbi:BFH_collapsed_G0055100.mRNA.1.CDS.1 [Saccharomyces cerevisiae]|nr:AIF_collapsed_G0056800.mRNA.1.CDS.1 [Saccharomyces cerevisiae]CAI7382531.1 BFH_collapsed_G0055100.mRNA.1.CDS.1 [Saccharomyces cerevisiae]CAI7484235.1 CIC_collapsed_G0055990.mRNA.1.CDS.1 [Saccharomyces cerevisiae]
MLDEAEEEELGQIMMEMNHWVDTVLKVVFDNANGRDIIFSSFHPDICIMLSLKQPVIPILFLTEGGSEQMADLRASSLQNGIRFAKKWNLLGIVSAAAPILKAPRLVQVVKSNGLVCVTYGVDNNDPENASIQIEAGVDAVIVDSVLAIRRGLTKKNEK